MFTSLNPQQQQQQLCATKLGYLFHLLFQYVKSGTCMLVFAWLSHVCMQDIQLIGRWNQDVLANNYLNNWTVEGCLALGGWKSRGDWDKAFWHARMTVTFPQELKDALYPWAAPFIQKARGLPMLFDCNLVWLCAS